MKDSFLTDEGVEAEIARLRESEYVKLAKREQAIRYRRRQYMYQLRTMEKRGKQLAEAGWTLDSLDEMTGESGDLD